MKPGISKTQAVVFYRLASRMKYYWNIKLVAQTGYSVIRYESVEFFPGNKTRIYYYSDVRIDLSRDIRLDDTLSLNTPLR